MKMGSVHVLQDSILTVQNVKKFQHVLLDHRGTQLKPVVFAIHLTNTMLIMHVNNAQPFQAGMELTAFVKLDTSS
jgi:hypothetical protein